jgi:hypothetical protein
LAACLLRLAAAPHRPCERQRNGQGKIARACASARLFWDVKIITRNLDPLKGDFPAKQQRTFSAVRNAQTKEFFAQPQIVVDKLRNLRSFVA